MKPKINKTITTKGGGNIVIPNKIISKEYPEGISKDSYGILDLKSLGIPYVEITNLDEIIDNRSISLGYNQSSSYYVITGLGNVNFQTGKFILISNFCQVLNGYKSSDAGLRIDYTFKKGDKLVLIEPGGAPVLKAMIPRLPEDVKYETNIPVVY